MALTVTGLVGELRWAYHRAGEIRDWTVRTEEGRTSFSGLLDRPDAFRLSQQPLVFVAPHARGAYRWPVLSLQVTGASCTATLGPLERSHVLSDRPT